MGGFPNIYNANANANSNNNNIIVIIMSGWMDE